MLQEIEKNNNNQITAHFRWGCLFNKKCIKALGIVQVLCKVPAPPPLGYKHMKAQRADKGESLVGCRPKKGRAFQQVLTGVGMEVPGRDSGMRRQEDRRPKEQATARNEEREKGGE